MASLLVGITLVACVAYWAFRHEQRQRQVKLGSGAPAPTNQTLDATRCVNTAQADLEVAHSRCTADLPSLTTNMVLHERGVHEALRSGDMGSTRVMLSREPILGPAETAAMRVTAATAVLSSSMEAGQGAGSILHAPQTISLDTLNAMAAQHLRALEAVAVQAAAAAPAPAAAEEAYEAAIITRM